MPSSRIPQGGYQRPPEAAPAPAFDYLAYHDQVMRETMRNAGLDDAILDDPTLGPLARTMFAPGADPRAAEIAMLRYQRAAQREAQGEDPDVRARRLSGFHSELNNYAGQLGLGGDWGSLAQQAIDNNWDLEHVKDLIAANITMETANRAGMVQQVFGRTREAAKQYYFDVDNETMLSFARQIAAGELGVDAIDAWARDVAKQRYGHLADVIDSGITLRDYFSQHRQEIGKLLEIAPDQVDLQNDQRFSDVMTKVQDDGTVRAMTITEAGMRARSLDDWKRTNNASQTVSSVIMEVGRTMGVA